MTLYDRWDNFVSTYIRKTPDEIKNKKVENITELDAETIDETDEKFSMVVDGKKLTPEMRRRMALTAPFYMKGVRKKCRDSFRAGYTYKKIGNKRLPPKEEMKVLNEFNRRNDMYKFLSLMKQDSHIYGDGLALILFINDQHTKKPDLSSEPKKLAEPYKLKRIDPERMYKREYKNKYWKEKGIKHYVYEKKNSGFFSLHGKIFIHPKRVLPFKETDFAFSRFGISDMDILRHVINSCGEIDIAAGETLKNFSYGIIEWTKDGADGNTMKAMRKIAIKHPHTFIGNEQYHLNVHNLETIDPKPFYDYIIMAIAAVLVMPTHVLKGLEIGETSGAEAGYVDYNKDIRDSQNLVYKPQLEKLYKMLFRAKFSKEGTQYRKFDYDIEFNPIYVGEFAEAEIDAKRSATIVNLKAGTVIDNEESRTYLNEGHTYLDPKKKIPLDELALESKKNELEMAKKSDDEQKEPIQQNPRTIQAVPKKEKEDKSDNDKLKATDILDDSGKIEEALQEKRLRQASITKYKKLQKKMENATNDKS